MLKKQPVKGYERFSVGFNKVTCGVRNKPGMRTGPVTILKTNSNCLFMRVNPETKQ